MKKKKQKKEEKKTPRPLRRSQHGAISPPGATADRFIHYPLKTAKAAVAAAGDIFHLPLAAP